MMEYIVGSLMAGLSCHHGVVHAESSLMSAATDVRVWEGRDANLTARK